MLKLAKSGKYDGYLLEGMACPGGCVAGAGTLLPITRATTAVKNIPIVLINLMPMILNIKIIWND